MIWLKSKEEILIDFEYFLKYICVDFTEPLEVKSKVYYNGEAISKTDYLPFSESTTRDDLYKFFYLDLSGCTIIDTNIIDVKRLSDEDKYSKYMFREKNILLL